MYYLIVSAAAAAAGSSATFTRDKRAGTPAMETF